MILHTYERTELDKLLIIDSYFRLFSSQVPVSYSTVPSCRSQYKYSISIIIEGKEGIVFFVIVLYCFLECKYVSKEWMSGYCLALTVPKNYPLNAEPQTDFVRDIYGAFLFWFNQNFIIIPCKTFPTWSCYVKNILINWVKNIVRKILTNYNVIDIELECLSHRICHRFLIM